MFEACFAVDDHVTIIFCQAIQDAAQYVVGKAITTTAFRAAHDD